MNKTIPPLGGEAPRWLPYLQLIRFHRPIGILLLLWPTLWALWLAGRGHPDYFIVGVFIVGVVVMRSAGCVINDIADRHFDGLVARTQSRPLVTGKATLAGALFFLFILLCIALFLVLSLNRLTILCAVGGAALALIYPWLKRVTYLPQLGLGLAFSWGIPMSFAAIGNKVPLPAWVLFITAVVWPMIYDTFYAMEDKIDDLQIGIKSTAILFDRNVSFITAVLQSVFVILLIVTGYLFTLKLIYFLSLIIVGGLFIYQQYLIKKYYFFKAFSNNHWVGCTIFMGIFLNYLI